jgi:hypothetical protein
MGCRRERPRQRAAATVGKRLPGDITMYSDDEIMEALADLAAEFESCGTYESCDVDPWEGCEAYDLAALEAFCGVQR